MLGRKGGVRGKGSCILFAEGTPQHDYNPHTTTHIQRKKKMRGRPCAEINYTLPYPLISLEKNPSDLICFLFFVQVSSYPGDSQSSPSF